MNHRGNSKKNCIRVSSLSFGYDSMTKLIFKDLSFSAARGWTGVVGPNGAGKTTLLEMIAGLVEPSQGNIQGPKNVLYCPQRTDDEPPYFEQMMNSLESEAIVARARLGVEDDWPKRWSTLSHGERKRAQVALILWQQPDVVVVDEPTNHLDKEAREILGRALSSFTGIGLLVSHDRQLLDRLCYQCLFISPPTVKVRPGGYSEGVAQEDAEELRDRKLLDERSQEVKRLQREARKRRDLASRSHRLRSKRGLAIKDHDARAKINKARVTGKDGTAGRLLAQMEGRIQKAKDELKGVRIHKRYEMGVNINGEKCKRSLLFTVEKGQLPLGEANILSFPRLYMAPTDRVALVGPNGGGKSTFLRHLMSMLTIPSERVTYIPQEIDEGSSRSIIKEARSLNRDVLGRAMSVVRRLGSIPERMLETDLPSPGEVRKLMLALGLAQNPYLIVLDEPTNHLDLASIRCVEEALAECGCGLLLVSHDHQFLERLTEITWSVEEAEGGFSINVQ